MTDYSRLKYLIERELLTGSARSAITCGFEPSAQAEELLSKESLQAALALIADTEKRQAEIERLRRERDRLAEANRGLLEDFGGLL